MRSGSMSMVAAVAGLLFLATTTHAYVLDEDGAGHPLHWAEMPVSYYLVTDNAPVGADGEAAVHSAFETWNAASTNVQYDFAGSLPVGAQALDGKNVVYWVKSGWPHDPTLAAITFRYFDTSDGHLLDADTVFNGDQFVWTVDGTGYDIQNSATHEIGHMSGLGHSPEPAATMYAETSVHETSKRSLADDDRAAIEAIYGGTRSTVRPVTATSASPSVASASSSSAVTGNGGGGGGCRLTRADLATTPSELFFPLALLLALGIRQRRRATSAARR